MKKLLFLILALVVNINAWSEEIASGSCGDEWPNYDNVTWSLSDDGVLTLSGSGVMRYASTQTINGKSVTNNSYGQYYESIKTVVINNGVTSIGYDAFYGCSSLTSINIPSSVTSIESNAFLDCSSLTSINIPSSVTSIGWYAFSGCSSLTSINIPSSVTSIEHYAFRDCSSMSSINIPSSVTSIGQYAFSGCSSLTSINIPSSVTSIGSYAFYGCSSLTSINIPSAVTSIGSYTFSGCSSLTSITIPSSMTSIGNYAFSGCSSLEFMKIGGNSADIKAPSGLNYLPNNAVLIIVPSSLYSSYIASADWQSYVSRITTEDYIAQIAVNASPTPNGSAVINAVGSENANKVTNIKVKGTINSYDFMAFRTKMPCLRKVDLSEATIVDNNYEYYSGCHSEANVMGSNVFNGKPILEIKLPNNLETINASAFSGCTDLKTIDLGSNVKTINSSAFYNCYALKTVNLGSNLKTINSNAFYRCSALQDITLPETVETIGNNAFELCSSLSDVALTNVSSLGYGAFIKCYSLKKVVLPNSIKVIPGSAFSNSGLEEVQFGANIESIGSDAFSGCSKLTSVTFPGKINRIEYQAFNKCTGLTELQIPASVNYIGSSAFGGCDNIKNIYVEPALPTPIEQATFSNVCYNTATLHYPSQSKDDYYWHTVWGKFINQEWLPADFAFNFIYLSGDKVLNIQTGRWVGQPEIEIGNGGGLITEGDINQDSEKIEISSDGKDAGSVISSDNNLTTNELVVNINITANKWFFFCFPFDIDLSKVTFEGDYVWRTYDAKARAATGDGWKNITGTKIYAGKGYIFQGNKTGTLSITVTKPSLSIGDANTALETAESDVASNASWNFVGNPYLSYYGLEDIATSNFTAPITRWTGSTYEAVSPQDDGEVQLHPFEAFFVQKPSANATLPFAAEGQVTKTQSLAQASAAKARAKARRAKEIKTRQLINLTVSADDEIQDKTRIVFNDQKMLCYESECDAVKFYSSDAKAQIYTIDQDNVNYAINERPLNDGNVILGFSAQKKGTYTIEAARLDRGAILVDKYEGVTFDLSTGSYVFSSKAGTFTDRFEINGQTEATAIADAKSEDATAEGETYNMAGQRINGTNGKGVYMIKNGNSVTKVLK